MGGLPKDFLRGINSCETKMYWLPSYFHFTPKAHTERVGVGVVDRWNSAARMFITQSCFIISDWIGWPLDLLSFALLKVAKSTF
jgi:hypothetical protein